MVTQKYQKMLTNFEENTAKKGRINTMGQTFSGAYLGPGPSGGRFLTPDEVQLQRDRVLNREMDQAFPDVPQQWRDGLCRQALEGTDLEPDEIAGFFCNVQDQLQSLFDDWARGENRNIRGISIFRHETPAQRSPVWALIIVRDEQMEKLTTFRNGVFFPIRFSRFKRV